MYFCCNDEMSQSYGIKIIGNVALLIRLIPSLLRGEKRTEFY